MNLRIGGFQKRGAFFWGGGIRFRCDSVVAESGGIDLGSILPTAEPKIGAIPLRANETDKTCKDLVSAIKFWETYRNQFRGHQLKVRR